MESTTKAHQFHHGISKARERALELRVRVQNSHAKVKDSMRHFDESREAFMKLAQDRMDGKRNEAMQTADRQLRSDSNALKRAMEELRLLHLDLSSLDFELHDEEQRQQGGQSYLDRMLDAGGVPTSTIESKTIVPVLYHEDKEMHPLLEQYFDVLGDIENLRERLNYDLPPEHAEKMQQREQRLDQDETLSTTDDEFTESLRHEQEELQAQLNLLTTRAADLLANCLAAGLDANPLNYVRESDYASSVGQNQNRVEQWLGKQAEQHEYLGMEEAREENTEGSRTRSSSPPLQVDSTPDHVATNDGSGTAHITIPERGVQRSGSGHDSKMDDEMASAKEDHLEARAIA